MNRTTQALARGAFVVGTCLTIGTNFTSNATADELLAAWEFDEADVNGANVSARTGSASNTTGILQADATIVDGALSLDGDGDYLEFGNDLTDLRTQTSMTIAAWVNTNSEVSSLRRIVEHEDNTYFWAENGIFQYTTHGTPGGSNGRALSTTAPTVGTWQHVLVTFTGGQAAQMYINGVLEGSSSVDQATIPDNLQTFQIGARRSGSGAATNFWDGLIDDVGIWNCELGETEIHSLAGIGAGGYPGRVSPSGLAEDCNGDGVPDTWYESNGFDPCDANIGSGDPDGDTLTTLEEYDWGTNPNEPDTDGDTLNDNDELNVHNTNPTDEDSDGDGLEDGAEINTHMTDPNEIDSDSDGLADGDEVNVHTTDPNDADSDDDGFDDGAEIASGTDPNNVLNFPVIAIGSGLFVYYSFDDADIDGDNVKDKAGDPTGPFDGIKMNGGPSSATGLFGEGLEFSGGANNGDWEYIDMSAHASALGALTEGSIAAWIKTPNDSLTTDVLTIFAISDEFDGSSETRYWVSNGGAFGTGTLAYGVRNDGPALGAINSGATNPLLDGEWHHVAVTFAAADTMARLYIDGTETVSGTSGFFADVDGANTAGVGRNKDATAGGGQWFFDGTMDDFAIWNRPLTDGEVAFIHAEGLEGNSITPPGTEGFQITEISRSADDAIVSISWIAIPGDTYFLEFSKDLVTWEEIDDSVATARVTTIEDNFAHVGEPRAYYRVRGTR